MTNYKIAVGHKRDMYFVVKQDKLIERVFYSIDAAEKYLDEKMSKQRM